ncbi:MAG: flagellar motor switch protein FliN [Alphaproteobacteria bacterium]|jgi:flagellar motor switch protein FliN/FliY|nr:flagellar motor switch protein FliN [Alphaproteobacteria bacterium]
MAEENETEDSGAKAAAPAGSGDRVSVDNLRVLENIDVKLTVEVGSTDIRIRDLLRLNEGSVVELDRLAGDPLDILANGTIIARGEVVMVGERFGIRFSEIVSPEKRMENL